MRGLVEAYGALTDVFVRKAFVGEAVKKQGAALSASKGSLRLTYGVIEHTYLFDYQISRLVSKAPKTSVAVLLKMGMYAIKYMDDVPAFAAVDEIVKTACAVGKSGVKGFLNAVLRKYAAEGVDLIPEGKLERLSAESNRPVWLVKRYIRELGEEKALSLLSAKGTSATHVRASVSFGKENLRAALQAKGIAFEETPYGFLIRSVGALFDLFEEGKATAMSLGSAEICEAALPVSGDALDCCAAPGGKSVYLAERIKGTVTATDLHPHRVELIKKYAERMKVKNVRAEVRDQTEFCPAFEGAFSLVLLDAPCSGFGTLPSNPDVVLFKTESDVDALARLQRALLENVSRYVSAGGKLVYSTCSDLPSECGENVRAFLAENAAFALKNEKYTEINEKGGEGFYYAVLEKK